MAKEAATIELIWDLMRGRTDDISRVEYFPQKPAFPADLPYEQPFERTSPEAEGLPSRQIEELLRALKTSKELHMHTVMILKGGKVIGETAFSSLSTGALACHLLHVQECDFHGYRASDLGGKTFSGYKNRGCFPEKCKPFWLYPAERSHRAPSSDDDQRRVLQ